MNQTLPITNPLLELHVHGQSVWLDDLHRGLIESGELGRHIVEDGVTGVTSNPAIFAKAMDRSSEYAGALAALAKGAKGDARWVFEQLATEDVQRAADALRQVYDASAATDGYVSLEVSPDRAYDTAATLEEARRLWRQLARPNVMIKIPGTEQGLSAIGTLLAEGININITLLFDRAVYEKVALAYIEALEGRAERGEALDTTASVASFFVSRIDTAVDARIEAKLATAQGEDRARLQSLLGNVAIANAKLAYQSYQRIFSGTRWTALHQRGAQPQRILWASTGTKNPRYRDVRYIEELIGPETVNTMPPETLAAFRDHGQPRPSLESGVPEAEAVLRDLEAAGISLPEVTASLLTDGVEKFAKPFTKALCVVERRLREAHAHQTPLGSISHRLPIRLARKLEDQLAIWHERDGTQRLWAKDATLWTNEDEAGGLGWLDLARAGLQNTEPLDQFAEELKAQGFSHVLLLGMGGAGLCAELWQTVFGKQPERPELVILDSTDPAQIHAVEQQIKLDRTLFIIASTSGAALESRLLEIHFHELAVQRLGAAEAAQRFVAITAPGSPLAESARARNFRQIFECPARVGGRYAAFSNLGLVPAAALGLDVVRMLAGAERMRAACAPSVAPKDNSALLLGTLLSVAANSSVDKLTLVTSPGVRALGAWVEQLIAESTGKQDKGIIPIESEALGPPELYGRDRLFVYLRLETAPDAGQDAGVEALEAAGQPVVRIGIASPYAVAEEMMRWEIATAIVGSLLDVNPFSQPDVEASARAAVAIAEASVHPGPPRLTEEAPFFEGDGLRLSADESNRATLQAAAVGAPSVAGYLRAHLWRLRAGDYFALLGFLTPSAQHEAALQGLREQVRGVRHVATCLGFGPRFLYTTGHLHKEGPNSGVFLQLTYDAVDDLPVPGKEFSFGQLTAARAQSDLDTLSGRGRRVLRIHLGSDLEAGLESLRRAFQAALADHPPAKAEPR
jgi:transaldolase/glucose-6-phosphate isomerase